MIRNLNEIVLSLISSQRSSFLKNKSPPQLKKKWHLVSVRMGPLVGMQYAGRCTYITRADSITSMSMSQSHKINNS